MRDPAMAKMATEAYTTMKAGPLSSHDLASPFLPLQNEKIETASVEDLLPTYFDNEPVPRALEQQFSVLREQISVTENTSAQFTLARFQITPSMTDHHHRLHSHLRKTASMW